MAKTFSTIQQWDRWLTHFMGRNILDAERNFLRSLVANYFGTQALLIGTPHQYELLKSTVIAHNFLLSPMLSHNHHKNVSSIESELHELPIASGSIDLVLMPHVLEYFDNPRKLLAEACRIVRPDGHIVIFGFNPYSLWGLKKLWTKSKHAPWIGNFIKSSAVKDWLTLADFRLVKQSVLFYRPPIGYEKIYKKLGFMEWLGTRLHIPFGGIYVLVAQAKVIPLTPIKLRWQQKLSGVAIPAPMGIPRPSIRNPHA